METAHKTPEGRPCARGMPAGRMTPGALIAVVLLLAGCATTVRIPMLQPAVYHEATLTKTVAVLPFGGPGGREFAAEIEGVLGGIHIDNRPYFQLVDRLSLRKVLGEFALAQTGVVDQGTAAQIGKMVGAQGIYSGTITLAQVSDDPFRETRVLCAQKQIVYDKKGNASEGDCVRWQRYTVGCIKRTATFSVSPKLVEVRTGRILYARHLSASAEASGCDDTTLPPDRAHLMEKAKEAVRGDFRRDVAPHYVVQEIGLKEQTEGISSPEARQKLEQGIAYADKNRLDAACELWGQARILAPDAPSLLYNLGVCAESVGNLEAAMDLYRAADRRLGKPDDEIARALTRVGSALRNREKLREQLHTPGMKS